jgi:lycopene cyclase domain-containing protein
MWLYDGKTLWAYRHVLGPAVALSTLYLWMADAIAIRNQIWTISDAYTFGIEPFGLPIEEATFFLMTNLLVVQGLLLLFYGSHQAVPETVTEMKGQSAASHS